MFRRALQHGVLTGVESDKFCKILNVKLISREQHHREVQINRYLFKLSHSRVK